MKNLFKKFTYKNRHIHTYSFLLLCFLSLAAGCGGASSTHPSSSSSSSSSSNSSTGTESDDTNQNEVTGEKCGGVVCKAPNRCENNVCTLPQTSTCDTTNCPAPGVCKNNVCVTPDNPCAKVTCGELEVCYVRDGHGLCKPDCETTCNGKCTNDPSKICVEGQWVDPCSDNRPYCIGGASGAVCCGADTECISGKCVPQGDDCNIENEVYCKLTEYCHPGVNKCVKYTDTKGILCEYRPPVGKFASKKKLNWDKSWVYATPTVINITDDNGDNEIDDKDIPDIIFNTWDGFWKGYIYAISGEAGASPTDVTQHWKSQEEVYSHYAIAVADLDGDKLPEIVAVNTQKNGIIIFDHKGKVKHRGEAKGYSSGWAGGISIGDINADGTPEIVALGVVWSSEGKKLAQLDGYTPGSSGSEHVTLDIPVLADMNLDGYLDVVVGIQTYLYDPTQSTQDKFVITPVTKSDSSSEYAGFATRGAVSSAVANFQGEASSYPEIVAVSYGKVQLADWRGNILSETSGPPSQTARGTRGGAPTIADFDGDEQPEIGIAFSHYYAVYDVKTDGAKPQLELLWKTKTIDESSAITGSSVFDFDGDGKAEVVYNDEKHIHIYDGITGNVLFKAANTTGTAGESPVIADVDNDGQADIVVAANKGMGGADVGIQVFTDANNNWVPTRRIWNQHAYSVTNINKDGTVPQHQEKNWTKPWLNNFRQNVQEGNPFLAPNFVIEAEPLFDGGCGTTISSLNIQFRMKNIGARGVRENVVKAKVVAIVDGVEETLLEELNPTPLPPSGSILFQKNVSFKSEWNGKNVDIKYIADSDNNYNECVEDDNEVVLKGISTGAPDLSVTVLPNDLSSCSIGENSKATFTVVISNQAGTSAVAAEKAKVTLYAKAYGDEVKIGEVKNSEEIAAGGQEEVVFEWKNVPSDFQFKSINIRAVVDEQEEIAECSEGNNEDKLDNVTCYALG